MAKLYFRYGAMNCGKTTNLLQTYHNYQERGMEPVLLKPSVDTKAESHVQSRLGVEKEVDYLINPLDDITHVLKDNDDDSDVIIVDESQFLTRRQVDQLFSIAVLWDVPVLCYGLRTDFQSNAFEGSARLLELAHSLEEMKTICRCGKKATLNARLVDGVFVREGSQIAIDGVVQYESVCPACYFTEVGFFLDGEDGNSRS